MVKLSDVLEKSGYDVEGKIEATSPVESTLSSQQVDNKQQTNHVKQLDRASERWDERFVKATNFSKELAESFKMLRGKILYPGEGKTSPKTLMIASASPNEGRSFIAANLALSLARALDQYSLLVGCDLRRPSLSTLFGFPEAPGLADYLQNRAEIQDLIRRTSVKKLSVLPSGIPPVNPSELLSSAKMNELVKELSTRYDDRLVIFDSSPVQIASEATVLAQAVDAIVLVVRYGASGKSSVKKVVDKLGREKIIGVVFNGYRGNPLQKAIFKEEGEEFSAYYE